MIKLNKRIKRILFSISVVLFAAFICPEYTVNAQNISECNVSIEYSLFNGYTYSLSPSPVDGREKADRANPAEKFDIEYVYVFPAATQGQEFAFSEAVKIKDVDGNVLTEGRKTAVEEGLYLMETAHSEYAVRFMYASSLPQIYITVEDGAMDAVHLDKNNTTSGDIIITDGVNTEYDGELEYIKGRGNASWNKPQKPYNIKLASKDNLFGMGASKKYSLLTNYDDYTCIKNKVALEFADRVGIEYTSGAQQVDVYVNNRYFGNYLLCERVEVSENRIDIFDIDVLNEFFNPQIKEEEPQLMGDVDKDAWERRFSCRWAELKNQAAADVNGGYLLELDMGERYRSEPDEGFISGYGQPVTIKTPEYASQQQVEYIRDYYQKFEDAVISGDGYNSEGVHYSEYIDIDSFAKMYVFQEYVQNLDAGITSCYMYKDVDGKLKAGPVWDMDKSIGCSFLRNGKNIRNPENIWAADGWRYHSLEGRTIFSLLWTHSDFRQAAARQWKEHFEPNIESLSQNIIQSSEETIKSVIASNYVCKNAEFAPTLEGVEEYYYECFDAMVNYTVGRKEFMSQFLDENRKNVFYDDNGGYGVTLDARTYLSGEKAAVINTEFTRDDTFFTGWNTAADGSGDWYYPGDCIEIKDSDIVLYAQWDGMEAEEAFQPQQQEEISIIAVIIEKFKNIF